MTEKLLQSAILNNVEWCELMARSHGIPSTRGNDHWLSSAPMPPYYPNAISTMPGTTKDAVSNLANELPSVCGWKDSYADLELAEFGFKVLFSAQWYACTEPKIGTIDSSRVEKVSSEDGLERWVAAWGDTPNGKTIFTPAIMKPGISFLYRENASQIDAGLILNVGANVLGISNAFGDVDGIAQCIVYAFKNVQNTPVVGYGSQDDLEALIPLGFRTLGNLRVWLR